MKKTIKYTDITQHVTQQELVEYSNGVFGREEMYRLELHFNECELCCHALEGIGSINQPKNILDSINQEINPVSKKRISINYFAVAASALLILALGLTFWFINNPDKNENLALNSTKINENGIESISQVYESIEDSTQEQLAVSKESYEEEHQNTSEKNELSILKTQPLKKPVAKKIEAQEKLNTNSELGLEFEITSESDIAIAENENDKVATELSLSQQGIQNMRSQEVSAIETSRAKNTAADELLVLKDRKEAIPIGGMNALKKHIEQNLIYPQKAADNGIKGRVILEIAISANGSIKGITVVKGLGFGCDEEAKRLLAVGPKWLPVIENGSAIESKQLIKVKFKL